MEAVRVESRESSKKVQSYKDLLVWQKSMDFLTEVYNATQRFPAEERYGLVSQIRRSAVSIPSNIAEGSSRRSTNEFLRYLNIATGSLAELETQLVASQRLGFLSEEILKNLEQQADEISRMLQGLYDALQRKLHSTLDSKH